MSLRILRRFDFISIMLALMSRLATHFGFMNQVMRQLLRYEITAAVTVTKCPKITQNKWGENIALQLYKNYDLS
jgi:hypothetical protein